MQSFFIPDSTTKEGRDSRMKIWNNIMDEQFDLSYYIKGMTYTDTEEMSIFERREMIFRLVKRKKQEAEARKEASK